MPCTPIEKAIVRYDERHESARMRADPFESEGQNDGEEGNDVGPVPRAEAMSAPPDGVFREEEEIGHERREQPGDQAL